LPSTDIDGVGTTGSVTGGSAVPFQTSTIQQYAVSGVLTPFFNGSDCGVCFA
jgi:hypothetical protein